jgi:hypothetical protein
LLRRQKKNVRGLEQKTRSQCQGWLVEIKEVVVCFLQRKVGGCLGRGKGIGWLGRRAQMAA